MPLRTGPKRRASMASAARRTGVLLVVAAFAAAAAAGPASADRISQKRAEIAQVENELNAFNQQLDAAAEAYNRATSQLAQVQADIRENTRRLKLAKANLRIAKQHLAAFLVSSYKGDRTDVFEVLGSGSFTDLLNRVEYVQRMSDAEGELLAQVQKAEHEIQVRQAKLKVDQKKAVRLVAETKQHKADAEAAVAAAPADAGQPAERPGAGDQGPAAPPRRGRPAEGRRAGSRPAAAGAGSLVQQFVVQQLLVRLVRQQRRQLVAAPGRPARVAGRRHRPALPRRPLRVGRRQPVRVRLLGPDDVRATRSWVSASATTPDRSTTPARTSR